MTLQYQLKKIKSLKMSLNHQLYSMKHQHYISSLIILFLFTTLFTGCAHDERAEKAIAEAKQLLDAQPDSALSILDGIKKRKAEWPKSQRMQYELVYAQAQNKALVDFTTDSIVLEVAKYYDKLKFREFLTHHFVFV